MRVTMALPLAAAMVLGACGSSGDSADANGDGKISGSEAASAVSNMQTPRPGKYKTSVELVDFSMPGMPAGMLDQMKGSFSGKWDVTYCESGNDGKDAIKDMADSIGQGNCTYNQLDTSGSSFSVDMTCTNQGVRGHYVMNGTMTSNSRDMTMELTQDSPGGGGPMHMKSHVVSTRIGECDS